MKVKEINGALWSIDDEGHPIKRVKKKIRQKSLANHGTDAERIDCAATTSSSRSRSKRNQLRRNDCAATISGYCVINDNGAINGSDCHRNQINKLRRKSSLTGAAQIDWAATTSSHSVKGSGKGNRRSAVRGDSHVSETGESVSTAITELSSPSLTASPISTTYRAPKPVSTDVQPRGRESADKSGGGSLEELMTQRKQEHARDTREKSSAEKKPSKCSRRNTLGDLLRRSNHKSKRNNARLSTSKSLPSPAAEGKPSKKVKDIFGVIRRVDANGNKIKNLKRKSSLTDVSAIDCAATASGYSETNSSRNRNKNNKIRRKASLTNAADIDRAETTSGNSTNGSGRSKENTRGGGRRIKYNSNKKTTTSPDHRSLPDRRRARKSNTESNSSDGDNKSEPGTRSRPNTKDTIKSLSEPSSDLKKDYMNSDTTVQIVSDLRKQLKQSQLEASRLSKIAKKQKTKAAKNDVCMERMKQEHAEMSEDKRYLDYQLEQLKKKLADKEFEVRTQQHDYLEKIKDAKSSAGGVPDHITAQLKELKDENFTLREQIDAEKVQAGMRLEKKEEELRFIQNELESIRMERDQLNFQNELNSDHNKNRSNSFKFVSESTSRLMADRIFKQKKKSLDCTTHENEVLSLQERVDSLQIANEKLTKELEKATLTINDDDDDEIRKAKEIARAVSKEQLTRTASPHVARKKVVLALQKNRSNEGESALGQRSRVTKDKVLNTLLKFPLQF